MKETGQEKSGVSEQRRRAMRHRQRIYSVPPYLSFEETSKLEAVIGNCLQTVQSPSPSAADNISLARNALLQAQANMGFAYRDETDTVQRALKKYVTAMRVVQAFVEVANLQRMNDSLSNGIRLIQMLQENPNWRHYQFMLVCAQESRTAADCSGQAHYALICSKTLTKKNVLLLATAPTYNRQADLMQWGDVFFDLHALVVNLGTKACHMCTEPSTQAGAAPLKPEVKALGMLKSVIYISPNITSESYPDVESAIAEERRHFDGASSSTQSLSVAVAGSFGLRGRRPPALDLSDAHGEGPTPVRAPSPVGS